MAVLDSSIANVALPTMSRELHADASSTIWVVNAYQVAVTMCLLPLSSLGDVLGYRRTYRAGLVVFTAGSLGCALSTSLLPLVLCRLVQGVGAAALMSIAPALNRTIFPARMLGVAVGISALTVASASAAGPTLGGAILAVAPWPWLFAVNVPLGIAAGAVAGRFLPALPGRGGSLDVASALTSGPALALLVVGLDGFARHLAPVAIAAMLAASAALAVAFVRRQRALAVPMLPLELFGVRRFSFAVATSLCCFAAQGIAFVALPFLLQGPSGYSALESGLLFTAWPLAIAVVAPLAGKLSDRVSPPRVSSVGLAILALGLAFVATLPLHPSPFDVVWRSLVCGIGFGLFQAPNNREILGAAPRTRSASVAGVLATARLTGQSLGASAVAIVLGTSAASVAGAGTGLAAPVHAALWIAAAVATLATAISAMRLTPLAAARATSGT
jgi:DHA2 family multidrug resistance protein-like MFS transporter